MSEPEVPNLALHAQDSDSGQWHPVCDICWCIQDYVDDCRCGGHHCDECAPTCGTPTSDEDPA